MSQLRLVRSVRRRCWPEQLAEVLRARHGVVAEEELPAPPGVHRFGQAEGPLAAYERTVTVSPVDAGGSRATSGSSSSGGSSGSGLPGVEYFVTQEVAMRIGLPPVAWMFALPLRRRVGRIGAEPGLPWWLPPVRLPRRAAVVLVTLCALEVLVGYLADLLAYTMTYAGSEYRVGSTGQGVALGLSRLAAIGAVLVLTVADRRGRRPVLVVALTGGALLTSVGALAPSLSLLTASQIAAGALATAAAVLVGVMAAEEMPAGTRAWAIGVIGMCFGLGSGLALAALPLAGTGPGGWRWLFALAILVVPVAVLTVRWLPESSRYVAGGRPGRRVGPALDGRSRRMLVLLGAGAFLLALFADPGGALQNQYLRHERHLSPLGISLLLQVAGTIGGLGTLIGGRLADTRGRRPVAASGVLALTVTTLAVYFSAGAALWFWEIVSSAMSYGIGPALAVYGAELFPTSVRSRAGGALAILGAAGGLAGLGAAGALSSLLGGTGPALALLAIGPVVVAVLVVVCYPETASRPLEELNPGDISPL